MNRRITSKKMLPDYVLEDSSALSGAGPLDTPLKILEDVEKDHIDKILRYTGGNQTKAAQILGASGVNLTSEIKKYRLEQQESNRPMAFPRSLYHLQG